MPASLTKRPLHCVLTRPGDLGDKGHETVYQAAGLAVPAPGGGASAAAPRPAGGSMTCEVCMSKVPAAECATNSCGHGFCCDCWHSHLAVQIGDGKARHITCMAYKCGVVCDEELVNTAIKVGGGAWGGRGGEEVGREGRGYDGCRRMRRVRVVGRSLVWCNKVHGGDRACCPGAQPGVPGACTQDPSWTGTPQLSFSACPCLSPPELESTCQGKPELLAKYRQSHLESYLEDNPRVAFCPSAPWCGHAVQVRRLLAVGVQGWHSPHASDECLHLPRHVKKTPRLFDAPGLSPQSPHQPRHPPLPVPG